MSLKIPNFLIIAKSVEKTKPINGLIKMFPNTYKFCNNDFTKFILLLSQCYFVIVIYPYRYMDSLERFNDTTFPNKNTFYSKLYLEDIIDED